MSNTQNTAKQGNRFILKDASDSGYSRLLSQQGKPVLDPDLNVLASLASFQHIGPISAMVYRPAATDLP